MMAAFCQRYAQGDVDLAMQFLADPRRSARETAAKNGWPNDHDHEVHHTLGYALGTIGSLLDALGFPEQGPEVDQYSWLVEDDEDDEVAA